MNQSKTDSRMLWSLVLFCGAMVCTTVLGGDTAIVVEPATGGVERLAARELAAFLGRLYPKERFAVVDQLPHSGKRIRLTTGLNTPESYKISATPEEAIIAGGGPLGVVFGIYALLEKLGCGFYLSFDTVPPAQEKAFSFEGWSLADEPVATDRIVFNWHNFLSGCTGWNLTDWEKWITQSQKMRFNTVMVHAYGNNPMFTWSYLGKSKPPGYLSSTARGRDWGTEHVNNVHRLAGGNVFQKDVFGADPALAPEAKRAEAAQGLMQQVFEFAARRGMHILFALDVDTESSNPQELIEALPESSRFKAGSHWLPRPDTPEGYAYFKTEAESLLKLYPQIDRLAIWIRTGRTLWTELKREQLPPAWQAEFDAKVAQDSSLGKLSGAPGRFALGKVIAAFQRALPELGREDLRVFTGSWSFGWMQAADPFYPPGVPFLPLDYDVLRGKSELDTAERRAVTRQLAAHRPVIPIVWAHHDDGAYLGRSYTPYEAFASKLADSGAKSFGIIHWTTRPLDLYFKSLSAQVWSGSKDQPLTATCADMAERCFGPAVRSQGAKYLEDWVTRAPAFSRETSDFFIDRPFTTEMAQQVVSDAQKRLDLLKDVPGASAGYFREYERFMQAFFQAEALYQRGCNALKRGDFSSLREAVTNCKAEAVIEQYVRACQNGGMTRGEQGTVVSLNLKWLTYFISLRQAVGLEPVRIKYGPTRHEPLAQGAGRLTFHIDSAHKVWRVLGQKETGAAVFESPNIENELYRSGIWRPGAFALEFRPFLHDLGRQTPSQLRPGKYRLKLLVLDTANKPAELVFPAAVDTNGVARIPINREQTQLCGAVLEPWAD